MISKGLTQLAYIQSLMYCLSKEYCSDCEYVYPYSNDSIFMNCTLFAGRFAEITNDNLNRLRFIAIAMHHHIHNCEIGCDKVCVFKHNIRVMDECYFTDITNRIGGCVKNV